MSFLPRFPYLKLGSNYGGQDVEREQISKILFTFVMILQHGCFPRMTRLLMLSSEQSRAVEVGPTGLMAEFRGDGTGREKGSALKIDLAATRATVQIVVQKWIQTIVVNSSYLFPRFDSTPGTHAPAKVGLYQYNWNVIGRFAPLNF